MAGAQRRERKRRNWRGYVDVSGINTVPVRLAEPPKTSGATVNIEVLDKPGGKPDEPLAAGSRIMIGNDGFVSRPPSVAELEFLCTSGSTTVPTNETCGSASQLVPRLVPDRPAASHPARHPQVPVPTRPLGLRGRAVTRHQLTLERGFEPDRLTGRRWHRLGLDTSQD